MEMFKGLFEIMDYILIVHFYIWEYKKMYEQQKKEILVIKQKESNSIEKFEREVLNVH